MIGSHPDINDIEANKTYKISKSALDSAYLAIAAFACFLVPFASIPFALLYARERGHSSVVFAILVGSIAGSLAYGVNTTITADIDRYTSSLAIFRQTSLLDIFSIEGVYSSVGSHGYNLFAWIVSQFGDDQLLRSAVCFTFYSVVAYIVDDYGHAHGFSSRKRTIALLACITIVPFFNILSYAKSTPAFSVLLLATYLDFEKKSGWIPLLALYAFSVSIHTAVLPVVALRVALRFFKSTLPVYVLGISLQPLSALLSSVIPASMRTLPVISTIVYALDRFSLYNEFEGWGWAAASQDSVLLMGYRYYYVGIALMCIVLSSLRRNHKQSDFLAMGGVWSALCITIALVISADVFFRYSMPAALFFVLIVVDCRRAWIRPFAAAALGMCAVVGLVVQMAYFASLCDINEFIIHGLFGLEQLFG